MGAWGVGGGKALADGDRSIDRSVARVWARIVGVVRRGRVRRMRARARGACGCGGECWVCARSRRSRRLTESSSRVLFFVVRSHHAAEV